MLLSGCSWEAPETGVYQVFIHVLPDAKSVHKACKNHKALACALVSPDFKGNRCTVWVNAQNWEGTMIHELMHCFRIDTHVNWSRIEIESKHYRSLAEGDATD